MNVPQNDISCENLVLTCLPAGRSVVKIRNYMIILFTLIPIIGALLVILTEKISERLCGFLAVVSTGITLYLCSIVPSLLSNNKLIIYHMGGWMTPLGIDLVLDGFGLLMLIVINLVGFVTSIYSVEYLRGRYTSPGKFFALFLFLVAALNGLVLSGDIFNMYVFLEMACLASYSLVAFGCERQDFEASIRYQILGTVGSFFILLGIGFLYSATGTLDLADMSVILREAKNLGGLNKAIMFSVPLFMFGFSMKAALVPFHAWLPDAHPSAPAPISAMLSGVVIKVCSIYGIVRIFFGVIGMTPALYHVLLYAGLISIFFGALSAIEQTDFKRMLAFSSISQVGYVMLGFGLGTPLGFAGALFHILNHAAFKSLYFLVAGSVEHSTGTRNMTKLGGISEKMPVTTLASLFASCSLSGIPPFGGFWSKLLIIFACIQSGNVTVGIMAALGSVLTLAYFLKIQRLVFFRKLPEYLAGIKEVPFLMCAAMVIMALVCLGLGLGFSYVLSNLVYPAADNLSLGAGYGPLIMGMIPSP